MKPLLAKLVFLIAALLALGVEGAAQCALCKGAVAGSQDATQAASQINLAVLVLLVPPVLIFVGMFGIGYKYRNFQGGKDTSRSATGQDNPI
jgi:hypothetical protein